MTLRAWDAYGLAKAPVVLGWGALERAARGRGHRPPAAFDGDLPARLRRHLLDDLLPFWRGAADPVNGGFCNTIDAAGRPDFGAPKRVALQARIVYSLAAGYSISGDEADRAAAAAGARFLRERCWDSEHGGWFRFVAPDGAPLDDTKDGFTHAYAATGLLELDRVLGDRDAAELADQTLDLFDERAGDVRHGGVHDSRTRDWRPQAERKSLCVHLDLLAAEELRAERDRTPAGVARLRERADVMVRELADPATGWLVEYTGPDWRYRPADTRDQVLVGHQLKAALHLLRLERLTGERRYGERARGLVDLSRRHGWDARHGGFFQRLSRRGPRASNIKVWWTQCQGLLVLAALKELDGDPRIEQRLREVAGFALDAFRDPAGGEWHRTVWPDGRPRDRRKAAQDKGPFHTVQACVQLQGSPLSVGPATAPEAARP